MSTTPRLKIGLIGSGLIAQVMHLHHLRELADRFEVAAICDLSPNLRNSVGDAYGIPQRFERWEDLVAEPLDAVMILTSGSHAAQAIAASEAGRHVFVEKPMCFSVEEGLGMIRAARKAGRTLMVGYNKRYDPAYERLQADLGQIGEIRFARVTTLESPFQPYVAHYPLLKGGDLPADVVARLRAADDRNLDAALGPVDPLTRRVFRWVLLDSLVHELNAIRGLLGEPDRLDFAQLRERGVSLVLAFGDVECAINWVDLEDGIARYRMEFAFYAANRQATLAFPSPFLRNEPTQLILEGGTPGTAQSWETVETVSYDESFKRELLHFHACVVGNAEPRTSGLDSLRDIALCQAIVKAHVERRSIERPTELPEQ
jgi:predicted dehydrogenase